MIAVSGDGGFCIDSTEVTNADYDAFLKATGGKPDGGAPDGGMPAICGGGAYLTFDRKLAGTVPANHPVDRVTWCDALAYCAWAGKRLCGKLDDRDAGTGEFYRACSNDGERVYPYGDTYDASACNTYDFCGSAGSRDAGEGCEGALPGLFHMSGNVAEWIDSCFGAGCTSAGGYYGSFPFETRCTSTSPDYAAATQAYIGVGFRCCADVP
jgi:formylglycine-generating enzyme required for sulfatase activity